MILYSDIFFMKMFSKNIISVIIEKIFKSLLYYLFIILLFL